MAERLGLLIGASTIGEEESEILDLLKRDDVYKVAVDGGISIFIKHAIVPDYWLGDMDSTKEKCIDSINNSADFNLDEFLAGINKTEVSPIKDDTDMALGIEHALTHDCDEIVIYGGLGGKRMSHTFANVQLVHRYAKRGIRVKMISMQDVLQVVVNGRLDLPVRRSGYISIFSLTDVSRGVRIEKLFYEYEGDLTSDVALGVSNEFCGKEANVSVEEGALLVIYTR